MPAPSLTITHLKTSRQHEGGQLINRYWFQWSNRKSLASQAVRVELLDEQGKLLTQASVQLPKVKRTGGTDAAPVYDGAVWFYFDDVPTHEPRQLRYYTVNLLSKSDSATAPMDGVQDDLSQFM